MNDVINTILKRRSIRKYTGQISKEERDVILQCGLYAPNGGGKQMPRFLVIQNPETLEKLNVIIRDELASREAPEGHMMRKGILRARTENYHFNYHGPTLISAVCDRNYSNAMADCACSLENMQIAAASLGLGCCWSNQPHWLTDVPAVREVFETLGLKENEDIYGSISIGQTEVVSGSGAPRKEGRISCDIE